MKLYNLSVLIASSIFIFSCNQQGSSVKIKDNIVRKKTDSLFGLQINEQDIKYHTIVHKADTVIVTSDVKAFISPVFSDSCVIIVKSENSCDLIISNAVIGKNVKIIADGIKGLNGDNGITYPFTGIKGITYTVNGNMGFNGGNGHPGSNAVNLNIWLGIKKGANLYVSSKGGSGGNGGQGGNGQQGIDATCESEGGRGGTGGQGGNGGNAGKNGNVRIRYFYEIEPISPLVAVKVSTEVAEAGNPGDGGLGGTGGNEMRCGLFGWGGGKGEVGYIGEQGRDGKRGKLADENKIEAVAKFTE